MKTLLPLQPGVTYHIYNRGNNRENLFLENKNYAYFMQLFSTYFHPIALTYSYCLLPNHFHFLIQVKSNEELQSKSQVRKQTLPSQIFSNFFNAYTKAFNKLYGRTGSLFQDRFARKPITSEQQLIQLVFYIHFNPQKHGLVSNFREWPWSSYQALISSHSTKLAREEVIGWFGTVGNFVEFHNGKVDESSVKDVLDEER